VADAPEARGPSPQVREVVPEQVPWDAAAEISAAPAGRESVKVTDCVGSGPAFEMVAVKVTVSPGATGSGAPVMLTPVSTDPADANAEGRRHRRRAVPVSVAQEIPAVSTQSG
jgi:hypothetical protein